MRQGKKVKKWGNVEENEEKWKKKDEHQEKLQNKNKKEGGK